MAQPNYPILALEQLPDQETFRKEPAYDPCVRPEFEGGSESARSRHTRVPWLWTFHYRNLDGVSAEMIFEFWRDTCQLGSVVFSWVDPTRNTAYFVRFADVPKEQLEAGGSGEWRVDLCLREALGDFIGNGAFWLTDRQKLKDTVALLLSPLEIVATDALCMAEQRSVGVAASVIRSESGMVITSEDGTPIESEE